MEQAYPRVASGSRRAVKALTALVAVFAVLGALLWDAPRGSAASVPFSLNLSTTSQTIAQGSSVSSIQVSVGRRAGFTDRVFLGARTPSGITVRFVDNPIQRFTRLTVAVSSRVRTGRYTVSVQGSSKGRTATAVLRVNVVAPGTASTVPPETVPGVVPSTAAVTPQTTTTIISLPAPSTTVPPVPAATSTTAPAAAPTSTTTTTATVSDFTLEAATSILPIQPGGTASLPITIRRTGGFSQPLQFSGENLPAGFSVFFSPTPADNQVTAIFQAPVNAQAGTFPVLLRALAPTVAVQLSVGGAPVAPFSLTANPITQNVSPGGTVTYAITVARGAGFTAPVSLSGSTTATGATVTVSAQPDAGNNGTVTVTVPASVPAGTYSVSVTGTATGGTYPLTLTLVVGGGSSTAPSLTVTPAAATVAPGTGAVFTLSLANVGTTTNFAYGVSGQPAGSSVVISTTSSTSASVTVNIPAGAPSGVSTLAFSAIAGTTNLSANATLTVGTGATTTSSTTTTTTAPGTSPSFGLSATPGALSITRGSAGSAQITVTPSGGFTGTVTFNLSGLPTGVTHVFSGGANAASTTLTLNVASNATVGPAPLTITGTGGGLSAAIIVQLTVT